MSIQIDLHCSVAVFIINYLSVQIIIILNSFALWIFNQKHSNPPPLKRPLCIFGHKEWRLWACNLIPYCCQLLMIQSELDKQNQVSLYIFISFQKLFNTDIHHDTEGKTMRFMLTIDKIKN